MNGMFLLPGQEVDPSVYDGMSVYGTEPPEGLLELNGMTDGFVGDCPDGIDSDGRELFPAFGTDALGRCFYLGLTPLSPDGPGEPFPDDVMSGLEDMRMDWILAGGSHHLDTGDAMTFLTEYCSRFGLPSDDYGELLDMVSDGSLADTVTCGLPQDSWDIDTAMLMHDLSSILRYRGD